MKKSLLSTLVIAASLFGLASCGGKDSSGVPSNSIVQPSNVITNGDYQGELGYDVTYGETAVHYGIKVKVSISNDKISSVTIVDDSKNFTTSWIEGAGEAAKTAWDEKINDFLVSFKDRNAIEVYDAIHGKISFVMSGGSLTITNDLKDDAKYSMSTGATQSETRLLGAIHNAIAEATGKASIALVTE